MKDDRQDVRLLSIFHYVVAGITALFSCLPFIHMALGIAMLSGALDGDGPGESPPALFAWLLVLLSAVFILCGWTLSTFIFIAGRRLSQFRNRLFCLVIAWIECIIIPFGTILGVFTIVVLTRDSVMELFERDSRSGNNNVSSPGHDS